MNLFFLFLFSLSCSFAGLVDHLRKVEEKPTIHAVRNIDFIYMINLDRRPEKYAMSCEVLFPYGIYPYRFSAIDGQQLSLDVINEVGLQYKPGMIPLFATSYPKEGGGQPSHGFMSEFGKTYFAHRLSPAPIAISLSHISVLQDAWDSGYETIWVMEDDVDLIQDPNLMIDLIDKLDGLIGEKNWDVLFTDQAPVARDGSRIIAQGAPKRPDVDRDFKERYSEKYTANKTVSKDFQKVGARFGAYSMIIRRSGIRKMLDFWSEHKIFWPVDIDNYLVPGINRYSLLYDVVTNRADSIGDNL